jgi:nucleotide-binding universal stress UspA family protein
MTVLTPARVAIKEVLMATDYSPASEVALPYAVEMARYFDATLHVVHVLLPGEWEPTADDTTAAFPYEPNQEAQRHMASFFSSTGLEGVRSDYLIRRGQNVWEELSRIIEDKNIDMVVLGTHGRGGIGKLLIGSVAEDVFRKAACPVLTIGPHVAGRTAAPFRRIAFATDLTEPSLEHIPFIFGLAEEFQARLAVIHALQPFIATGDVIEASRQKMRQMIPSQPKLEYLIEIGEPADAIRKAAEQWNCDLIALGAHANISTHWGAATAHRIVAEAHCPVLTLH